MQAKGIVQFFLVLLILVSLYYLSFTFITANANNKAKSYAKAQSGDYNNNLRAYLDSIENKDILNLGLVSYTYKECKEKQLNLGLDLQGGMSTVLQISLVDLVKFLSNDSNDPSFKKALNAAVRAQSNSDLDFVTLFGQQYERIAPNGKLAAIFSTQDLRDDGINFNSNNDEVLAVIRAKSNEAVKSTYEVIRTRIDQFGVASPNVQLQEGNGRIVIELPGVDNPERVRKLLQASAKLEFWETAENSGANGFYKYIFDADKKLKDVLDLKNPKRVAELERLKGKADKKDGAKQGNNDEDGLSLDGAESGLELDSISQKRVFEIENPLITILNPALGTNENGQQVPYPGATVGFAQVKDTMKINKYLKMPEIARVFPNNTKLAWEASPSRGDNVLQLFGLKSRFNDAKPRIEGDVVTEAKQENNAQNGQVVVTMQMNKVGAKQWEKLTADNTGRQVAVVLDNKVYSAPNVNGKIAGGNTEISGNFTVREAKDLANILKAGSLPAPAKIIEEAIVGPTLGEDSIKAGQRALGIGLLLVLIFMVLWYNNAGIVADIALVLNLVFIIGILAALGATLTLPGMAGLVLTVGMAVDANVLIFERIREELESGTGIKKAIADGYAKSYSAILDANLTTLIIAIILYVVGLGPVKGFAFILFWGIVFSLFTAIFVTRLVFEFMQKREITPKFYTGLSRKAFKNLSIDFLAKKKISYYIVGGLCVLGLLSMALKGFDYGVDFKGGRNYVVQFNKDVNAPDVRTALTKSFGSAPIVKSFSGNNVLKITTDYLIEESGTEIDREVEQTLFNGIKKYFSGNVNFKQFEKTYRLSSQKVGPTIADDIKKTAIYATLLSLIFIFLYILARFRNLYYGLGAVVALAVNVIIVLAVFSSMAGILPFTLEIDQAFIAAILTVIGYSINDTVVVFDRIREYLATYSKEPMNQVINRALNSTLSRTLITSFTTLLVVAILFVFGGEVIRGFSFGILLGVIIGTLSSIFIASPIVADLTPEDKKRVVYSERAKRKNKKALVN